MEEKELQRAVEAILFAAGEPVELSRLAMVIPHRIAFFKPPKSRICSKYFSVLFAI